MFDDWGNPYVKFFLCRGGLFCMNRMGRPGLSSLAQYLNMGYARLSSLDESSKSSTGRGRGDDRLLAVGH